MMYFLTFIKGNKEKGIEKTYCAGFFETLEDAEFEMNDTDYFATDLEYKYAVIEEVTAGFRTMAGIPKWYKWYERECFYFENPEPKWGKKSKNFWKRWRN